MKQIFTFVLAILVTAIAGAQPSTSLMETLPKIEGPRAYVDRGTFLTKSTAHGGLQVKFQEGKRQANWAQFSTDKRSFEKGSLRFSAAPRVTFTSDGRTGYGAEVDLRVKNALGISHRAQIGGFQQHMTTARMAPDSPLSLKAVRLTTGNAKPITRLGPELKLGQKTRVSYGHGFDQATHQVLMTSNLRF